MGAELRLTLHVYSQNIFRVESGCQSTEQKLEWDPRMYAKDGQ